MSQKFVLNRCVIKYTNIIKFSVDISVMDRGREIQETTDHHRVFNLKFEGLV